jgi:hypothetical protein
MVLLIAYKVRSVFHRWIIFSTGHTVFTDTLFFTDLVNEGLAFALRANDFHTSRQLLILYSLVAAKKRNSESAPLLESNGRDATSTTNNGTDSGRAKPTQNTMKMVYNKNELPTLGSDSSTDDLSKMYIPPPPPPPPLDTDRLRSATNSDGLLAVLGAAQVLRAMQDGSAKRRVLESIESVEE